MSSIQSEDNFPEVARELAERFGSDREATVEILQEIQNRYRYLPAELLEAVCEVSSIRPADLISVATFYSRFRLEPIGKHRISVCTGTACHVKGSSYVLDAFRKELQLADGEDTDKDQLFTVEKVACLGCCTLAPVVQIDAKTYGHVRPSQVAEILTDFLRQPESSSKSSEFDPQDYTLGEIRIGLGSCCQAQGSKEVHDAVCEMIDETQSPVRIKPVGCVGMCHQVPLLELVSTRGDSNFFAQVQPEEVREIFLHQYRPRDWKSRLRLKFHSFLESIWSDDIDHPQRKRNLNPQSQSVCSFLDKQIRLATQFSGLINPIDLEEYRNHGGFVALQRVLTQLSSEDIIAEMRQAGIRGRGGAGFPTWRKWEAVRGAPNHPKYIICNGDEGDPGAFMDRMLLESFPYRILEGMMIAARAIGAERGFLYIRAEYPLAVRRIREAIALLETNQLLGDNILGTDFSFHLSVKEGAGAFVCGEETALIESMEGKRGMPRLRPPFPATSGLGGQPTLINNVETWALVPWVFNHSGKEFASYGTAESPGTKVFALAGKVRRGGLIEVPMGITIKAIVEEIGGSIEGGGTFKAVQIGGPSGGCIPSEWSETPVNFESLRELGAIMGSGGLVVLSDNDCMVDMARYFLQFTQEQSCGKCTFCRIGTRKMLDILDRLCLGKGRNGDIERLEELALSVQSGSLCGLGKTAPNPVLSTIRFFRDEYEEHINGCCRAGRCAPLIQYQIDDSCNGCTICAGICPTGAIAATPYRRHQIIDSLCSRCDSCRPGCPQKAIRIQTGTDFHLTVR